ncbi:MAG: molybdate ABC transporter permease subunit [Longimicrobiales bacterium]
MSSALFLSIQVTAVATVIIALLGLPLAHVLARRTFPGKSLVETGILLPLVLPPSVIGYYLLVGLGSQSPLTNWTGWTVLFTWQAAAIASAVVGMPLMVQAARAAIESVNPALENTARVLGSSELEVFLRITLPLAGRGVAAGLVLGAARAFGEFGATLMVAGNIPQRTQTVPLAIYDAIQAGRDRDATMLVLLTTTLAFASIWVVRALQQTRRAMQAEPVAPTTVEA